VNDGIKSISKGIKAAAFNKWLDFSIVHINFLNIDKQRIIMAEEKKLVGKVDHYYTKIGVAVVELNNALSVGDKISIEGATTNLQQSVDSMQVEHKAVDSAKKGDSVGLKVAERVRPGDNVYKVA
jgi:translation elongation factor EF-1alpha